MKKVIDLKNAVRRQIWASGEPENLLDAHNLHFQEAFADIAMYVDAQQSDNVNLVEFSNTNFKNGMSVIKAPTGVIQRIFTVANDNYQDPVFYRRQDWPVPEEWALNLYAVPVPLTKLPRLPMGFELPDSARDSQWGRARAGIWALEKGNIYLAPWTQSNELIVIEWRGMKTEYLDSDLIDPDIKYQNAVKLFMQYAHERDYGSLQKAMAFHNPREQAGLYDEACGDLIYIARERRKRNNEEKIPIYERRLLTDEVTDDAVPTSPDGISLAFAGNISLPGVDLDRVGNLLKGFGPNGIVTCGVIGGSVTDYDLTAGNQFHEFMKPYAGDQGAGGKVNAIWAAISAADRSLDGALTFNEFFGAKGNGKYYDVVLGDCHLFFLDTGDPAGITSADPQGVWLQANLALSTSPWNIVVMDQCPWGSTHQNATLQWAFKTWGAHLVVCTQARNYERLSISDLPVINCGLGGATPIEEITAPTANTVVSYSAGFGGASLNAKLTELVWQFRDVDGVIIDTLVLEK